MAAVIGLGFVGSALFKSFAIKKVEPLNGFDKYKNGGVGCFKDCLQSPMIFLCLPTLYDHDDREYNKSAIYETMELLSQCEYDGVVVLKSTVEPGTCDVLSKQYVNLSIMHNPEFLSAATAFHDFHYQDHVVLGKGTNCSETQITMMTSFYKELYPEAEISICTALESESMKSFVNCFYSVKIQFFNELYQLCVKQGSNFDTIKELMIKNKWINPMHTTVPGHDGKPSYGGACFPKDTNALLQTMKQNGTPHALLEGCIRERNDMREESHLNRKLSGEKFDLKETIYSSKISKEDVIIEKYLQKKMLREHCIEQ